jgi:hypothetical protein
VQTFVILAISEKNKFNLPYGFNKYSGFFAPEKNSNAAIEYEAWWAPETVRALCRRDQSLPTQENNHNFSYILSVAQSLNRQRYPGFHQVDDTVDYADRETRLNKDSHCLMWPLSTHRMHT